MIFAVTFTPMGFYALFIEGSISGLFPFLFGIGIFFMTIFYIWYQNLQETSLEINHRKVDLRWTRFILFQGTVKKYLSGSIYDVNWVNYNHEYRRRSQNHYIIHSCAIAINNQKHNFGDEYKLNRQQAEFITIEISNFLKKMRQ